MDKNKALVRTPKDMQLFCLQIHLGLGANTEFAEIFIKDLNSKKAVI